jgi:hypothetical protein
MVQVNTHSTIYQMESARQNICHVFRWYQEIHQSTSIKPRDDKTMQQHSYFDQYEDRMSEHCR